MKKKQARFRIRIFYVLLLAPTLLWGLLSLFGVTQKLDFDTGEKRNKHEMAEGTTLGNLTSELEQMYDDRVPFRSVLLRLNSTLNYAVELPYKNGIQPGLIALANATMPSDSATASNEAAGTQNGQAGGTAGQTNGAGSGSNAAGQTDAAGAADAAQPGDAGGQTDAAGTDPAAVDPTNPAVDPAAAGAAEAGAPAETAVDLTPYYETPSDAGYYPYIELAQEVIQGRDGWLFMAETLFDYLGATLQNEESLTEWGGRMQTLGQICQSKGQQLYYIALPNKCTAYPEYMPTMEKADYTGLMQLEDYLSNYTDVNFTFMDEEMLAAKRYGRLYYLNDTHWNGRGAMACMTVLHRMLGLEPIDQGALVEEEGGHHTGDLIYYTGMPEENFVSENSVDYYYKTDVGVNMIRGGEDTVDEYTSTAPDGRTVVLVGDSYRHHLMPYLAKDFAHVIFINEKILGPEHADLLNSADILLVEGVERNFFVNAETRMAIDDLISIMGS